MGDRRPDELRYTAFLSYSHKDAAAAGRVHRRLETYRMPSRLVGAETARGPVPARLAPIFRDREELPAATDLSKTVREALARSGALIVLCSPAAAESLWVAEEIETFRRIHPDRPILAAVLDGDPPDCFPLVLRAFGRDGTWHEPLATDLRRHRDGPRLGLLKLVAGITGIGLDALVQRDANRRVRRVMTVTAVALIAMLAMAALAWVAIDARREAERQRAEAKGQTEFMLTDLRERLREVGRLDIMTTANQRGLAYYDRQPNLDPHDAAMRARVLHAIGEDSLSRGHRAAALAPLREAFRSTAALIAQWPNDADVIYAHAQSEYWLGYQDYLRDDFSAARARFESYKALAQRLLAVDRTRIEWVREAAYAANNLCSVDLAQRIDAQAALRSCSAALDSVERVRALRPNDPSVTVDLANRHAWVADAWNRVGRWDRVLHHRAQQEALVQSLIRRDPRNLNYRDFWMSTQSTFADLLAGHGQPREARRWYEGAAATARMLRQSDPENAEWRRFERQIADKLRALNARGGAGA